MITPPSKGTPVDLDLISQIVGEVNSLRTAITGSAVAVSEVNQREQQTFGKVCFYSGKQVVVIPSVTDGQTQTYTFQFGNVIFSAAPNVSVSVRNTSETEGGWHVIPTIGKLDSRGCQVHLTFKKADEKGVGLELMITAIGISN